MIRRSLTSLREWQANANSMLRSPMFLVSVWVAAAIFGTILLLPIDATGIVLRSLAAGLAVACSFIRSNVVIEFYEPLTDEENPQPGPRGGAHWTAFADWMLFVAIVGLMIYGVVFVASGRPLAMSALPIYNLVLAWLTVALLIQLAAPYFAPELEVITRARGRSRGVWLAAALAGGGTALMLIWLS